MAAKRIEDMPREYALLMDPEQRRAALGDQRLKISGADFGIGETDFYHKEWEDIHFYDCIFYGVTHLKRIRNCIFEHCQFPGSNFQASSMEDVLFMRSDTLGRAYVMAPSGRNVRFVECDFGGRDPEPNHFGAISFAAPVYYERCTGKYMSITGDTLVSFRDCKFDSIRTANGTAITGEESRATVTIENCTFKGSTSIARSTLTSLTIRNSKFDVLDIGKSDVQGDVLIESVQAGAMIDEFDNARSITIRNSKFRGTNVNPDNMPSMHRALDCLVSDENRKNLKSVTLDGVECGRDEGGFFDMVDGKVTKIIQGCQLMGGTESTDLRRCTIPTAKLMLESATVAIDNYEGESASFVRSKIGTLSFRATAIVKAIDFTGAQVQKLDAKGLVRFTGQKIVTTGSNVHVP
ncbi:Right-handed parallel beta-helix repeat-containing protein [Cupriavidus oxalaticus]